ncbi:hypothetical protein OH77DRAFT_1594452 [Trametes cingulata]|nr:hypothetical protein OH77DRAFT_1594452 [Trametes cingulata]
MATSTRTVTAYRFPKWGRPHVYSIVLEHFAIDEGFDIPLFHNVFTVLGQVFSERIEVNLQRVTFDVFYTTSASTGGPNEALLSFPDGPAWKGEFLVLRRSKIHNGYVNLRKGDRTTALAAVFDVIHDFKAHSGQCWDRL